MKTAAFAYKRPAEIQEVLGLLGDYGGDAKVIAGGQSLIPSLNMRLSSPSIIVDINRLEELCGVQQRGNSVRVGALVRHSELLESPQLSRLFPLLSDVVPHIGHMAVRNRGTIGGSLAFADPAAELPAVAVALDAQIVVRKRGGERVIPACSFFHGLYQTALAEDELISDVIFPIAVPDGIFGFAELSRRRGDFAMVGIIASAIKIVRALCNLKIVIFGSEAAPLLVSPDPHFALGLNSKDDELAAIASNITKEMHPIHDHQGRADTKRRQAAVLLRRVLKDMLSRAGNA